MADPLHEVREHYADEHRLATRASVWRDPADGQNPNETTWEVVHAEVERLAVEGRRAAVLEVGCGMGRFAERLTKELAAHVVAVDQSPRMVELTSARGVDARVADMTALPFGDATFDVVVTMWVLYHLPQPSTGLRELRRVLRPGGVLVAVTNGAGHLRDLMERAGSAPAELSFSTQNGEDQLRDHFTDVTSTTVHGQAVFADHAQAQAYLSSLSEPVSLPQFEGPLTCSGETTVFVSR